MTINITSRKAITFQEGTLKSVAIDSLASADEGDDTASLVIRVTGIPDMSFGVINGNHDPFYVGDTMTFAELNNLIFYLGSVDHDTMLPLSGISQAGTENFTFSVTDGDSTTNHTVAVTITNS